METIETTENFEEMLNAFEEEQKKTKVKEGMIVDIQDGTVFVDVGEKVEGVLPTKEITKDGELMFKVGDAIAVVMTKRRTKKGEAVLSHRLAIAEIKRKEFMDKFKVGDKIKVKITNINKGGFVAKNDEGIEFFIPKSESALKLQDEHIGKKIEAVIIEIKKNGVVLSRKELLKERTKFVESIKDKVVKAVIKNIKKDGVVIEIEGEWSGFILKEDINDKKINYFKLKRGDEIEVKLIDADKMLFSINDPWDEVAESGLENGDQLVVTVTNIKEYGAFVDIGNGVEGFLHISEISWNSNAKIEDLLNVGDEINVEVTDLDIENKRLRVSYKSLLPKPAEESTKTHKEGDVVKGKVVNLTDIGGFIDVDGIVCFLPNRFVSWTKGEKAKDVLNLEDEYDFKVISIDTDNNKIILSKKDAEDSPYVAFEKNNQLGDTIKGVVKNIADFGVFVSLGNGVEALIRKNDLEKDISEYKVDDEIEGKIIELDAENKRIKLSQK